MTTQAHSNSETAVRSISPQALKVRLRGEELVHGGELALIDVREEADFGAAHLFLATCIPLSRLEVRLPTLVPRRGAPVVLCDGGLGREGAANTDAEIAAARMVSWGYLDVCVLAGGVSGWQAAGYSLFSGVNVPSKAFGEVVEHEYQTPSVSADELKSLLESDEPPLVLDSRPLSEYRRMSIPSGINVPGAELVYRLHDLAPSPERLVVVNCAGRTRSIIGAQSLINAAVPNRVVALRNGTMGWELAGHALEHDQQRRAPQISPAGLVTARARADAVARHFSVRLVDWATVQHWQQETAHRTLYLLDVRQPEEFALGHLPGSRAAPGGQLVQATDEYLATHGARLVLVDDTRVRATMTASWLQQLGWDDVFVLEEGTAAAPNVTGTSSPPPLGQPAASPPPLTAEELLRSLRGSALTIADLTDSRTFRRGHVPGAWWIQRARLAADLDKLPRTETLVLTSDEGLQAQVTASEAAALWPGRVKTLAGGTSAWTAAGLPLEDGPDTLAGADVYKKPYERGEETPAAMQDYLTWEVALLEKIAADGDARFKFPHPLSPSP